MCLAEFLVTSAERALWEFAPTLLAGSCLYVPAHVPSKQILPVIASLASIYIAKLRYKTDYYYKKAYSDENDTQKFQAANKKVFISIVEAHISTSTLVTAII